MSLARSLVEITAGAMGKPIHGYRAVACGLPRRCEESQGETGASESGPTAPAWKRPYWHWNTWVSDPKVRAMIEANFAPELLYGDILERGVTKVPELDLCVAGCPCQSFSMAGNGGA